MSVFEKIVKEIHVGMTFRTPVKDISFTIDSIGANRVVFFVGAKTRIPIPEAIWNGIPNFLRGKGWVKIGAGYNVAPKRTLQEYIDQHPSRGTQHSSDANYIASILEYLNIVEVKHSQTSEIRLK